MVNTRSTTAKKVGEEIANAGATLQGNQVHPQVQGAANDHVRVYPLAKTDREVKEPLFQMSQAITTQAENITAQANREVVPPENQHASTMASRLKNLTTMNPPIIIGPKFHEDPQDFLDEFYKIVFAMGVSTTKKAEPVASQHKDVAHTLYNQWKDSRHLGDCPMTWEILIKAFLDIFFQRIQSEAKVEDLFNLCQRGMSVKEYSLKFIKLSKYAFLWFPMFGIK